MREVEEKEAHGQLSSPSPEGVICKGKDYLIIKHAAFKLFLIAKGCELIDKLIELFL